MIRLRTYVYPLMAMAIFIAGSIQVNAQSSAWDLEITGQDQNGNQLSIVVGTAGSATDGYDDGLDQFAPPAPPAGSFDIRITDGSEDYFKQIRSLTTGVATWNLSTRPSAGGGTEQVTLTWDNTSLTSTTDFYLLEYNDGTGTVQVNLAEQTTLALPGGPQDVKIIHVVQDVLSESFSEGWQLVGYPAEGDAVDPFTVFSNGINGTFFSHNLNYSEETVFTAGVGNWIRLSGTETVSVNPPFLTSITRNLNSGWYLISGPGMPVAFSDIEDPNGVLVAGSLQGYNGSGYAPADTLKPGRGYWVNASGNGSITISSDITSMATKQLAKSLTDPAGFVAFRVRTKEKESPKFYLGGSLSEQGDLNPLSFSMPPLPPTGAFDIRFDNNSRLVDGANGTLLVRSPGDSLTLTHANQTDDKLKFSFIRENSDEEEAFEIGPDESVKFSAEGVNQINVQTGLASSVDGVEERPKRIELSQNYPNPFNPSTVISYNLPQQGAVSLQVFDMTGRRIAVLAEEFQAAGAYTYEFDASNLSSGVYMYRLQTSGTVLTRKMTLIK